jgi:hypothetical protein
MTPKILERLFGTNSARVYAYQGPVPEQDISSTITEMFTQAAGSNLISCVVTFIKGTIIVYTRDQVEIDDIRFRLIATLPVVESESVDIPVEPMVENQTEEQQNAG